MCHCTSSRLRTVSSRSLASPPDSRLSGAIIYYLEHIELEVLAGGNATEGGSPYNDLGEAIWCRRRL